eukprot:m.351427 g.351427  ORF g.351427 m.351427 type:complete len:608 (+) comp20700_c0_seq3:147-1970(+)
MQSFTMVLILVFALVCGSISNVWGQQDQCNAAIQHGTEGPMIGSNHIGNKLVDNIGECCLFCQNTTACVAFDFAPSTIGMKVNVNCWIKDNKDVLPAEKDRISGVKCQQGNNNCTLPPAPAPPTPPAPATEQITVTVQGDTVLHETIPEYASFDIDWWHNTTGSGGDWGNASILYVDLKSSRLRNLVAALEPSLMRIGGSQDNIVKYEVGGMSLDECNAPTKFRGTQVSLCLTAERWLAVLEFYNATRAKMVFGVSYFTGTDGQWNSTNVEAFLRFTAAHGFVPYGLELGEEMQPTDDGFEALVNGYQRLRTLASTIWPGTNTPVILGPSCGMGVETVQSPFMGKFLNTSLPLGSPNIVNMHSYNNDGGWPNPGFLSQTLVQAKAMMYMTRRVNASTPLWCGECGPHNGGGLKNVTDKAVSSFWYIDALGALARLGFAQHGRQALVGSHYGLVQDGTYTPNPDYFALLGWKRLMGTQVMNTTVTSRANATTTPTSDLFHVYAHCARKQSGVAGKTAFAFVNIAATTTYSVQFEGIRTDSTREEYHFTNPGGLMSESVALNGNVLSLDGDDVPAYNPKMQSGLTPLMVQPYSYGFIITDSLPGSVCAN